MNIETWVIQHDAKTLATIEWAENTSIEALRCEDRFIDPDVTDGPFIAMHKVVEAGRAAGLWNKIPRSPQSKVCKRLFMAFDILTKRLQAN